MFSFGVLHMRTRVVGAVWVFALLAACIPETQLRPRADARQVPGDTSAAVAEAHGVRLIADGAAWKGRPGDLERRMTPVEVRVENHSGRTLNIRYANFDLLGASRFHYAALSPERIQESGNAQPQCVAAYTPGYWGLYGAWGPRWGWRHNTPWRYPWPGPYYDPFWDPFYGPAPYTRCEEPLPTRDMTERALPEGTLEDGGTVSGFLYFQGIGDRERQVILHAQLVDAKTNQPFGELSIPFQVRRD